MKTRALFVVVLLALAFAFTGCGASSPAAEMAAGSARDSAASPALESSGAPPAQQVAGEEPGTWKRSQLQAHTSRIKVGDREELPVRSMQAKVAVDGHLARVLIDLTFYNPSSSTYEGSFQLRLPDGASPYFFAFGENVLAIAGDAPPKLFVAGESQKLGLAPQEIMSDRAAVWRGPKEARMVPREKAAFAYGATVRRSVDPALVEWSGPSVYSARIFPIAPQRSHRVVFGYDVPLVQLGDTLEYSFDLPEKVGSVVVDLGITEPAGAEIAVTPKAADDGKGKRYFRFESPTEKSITVRVKKAGAPVLTGTDAKTGAYFATTVKPDLAALAVTTGAPGATSASAPRAMGSGLFLVDTSVSSNPDRFNIWLRLLASILENNRDTMKTFGVMFFNIEQSFFKNELVANTKENVDAVLAHANTLALEGATDLAAALSRAAKPPWAAAPGAPAKTDLFLLSDGASTWGEADLHTISRALAGGSAGALYAYQTGLAGTDGAALSQLTRESGGAVFSVVGDSQVAAASTAHRARPYRIVETKIAGGSDLLLAGRPKYLFPGQSLTVVARGTPDKGAALELTLEGDAGRKVVKAALGEPLPSGLAVRAYGQVAVAQLEELSPATDAFGKAYSTHFRVTGKTCSLLMLESEADYQRFDIRPEEDALVIKQRDASRVVEVALTAMAASLGNPKAAFLQWLDSLERMPGMTFRAPTALKLALDRMPESSFRVESKPLAVVRRDRAAVSPELQQALRSHKLEYDAVSAEAERRRAAAGPADALKALSSLVEENPGDSVLARDIGFSAMTWGLHADAYHLFRRVAAARPFEPQTYRAMASALASMSQADLAIAYFEVGLAGQWDGRFGEFRKILGIEYQHLLRRIAAGELKTSVADFAKDRLTTVASEFPIGRADVLVMITWNTDNTDVDLHVIEPNKEDCHYAHRVTSNGGRITQDVTQGYGPEMYTIASAPSGTYQVQAHYFASDQNRASTRTKVQATVFEDWGTSNQRVTDKLVTLEYGKSSHPIASITHGPSAKIAAP